MSASREVRGQEGAGAWVLPCGTDGSPHRCFLTHSRCFLGHFVWCFLSTGVTRHLSPWRGGVSWRKRSSAKKKFSCLPFRHCFKRAEGGAFKNAQKIFKFLKRRTHKGKRAPLLTFQVPCLVAVLSLRCPMLASEVLAVFLGVGGFRSLVSAPEQLCNCGCVVQPETP